MRSPPIAAFVALVALVASAAVVGCASSAVDEGDSERIVRPPRATTPPLARTPYAHRERPDACAITPAAPLGVGGPRGTPATRDDAGVGSVAPDAPDAPREHACFADADCAGVAVCVCARDPSRTPHACVPSACRLDGDCGAGGYCSPSLDATCPAPGAIVGYFCHGERDACIDDGDCTTADGAAILRGLCVHDARESRWRCSYAICSR